MMSAMNPTVVSLIFVLFPALASVLNAVSIGDLPGSDNLMLTSAVLGPESLAFDRSGGGPYTGVSDGRILKWQGHSQGWAEFAVPPLRSRAECDGSSNIFLEGKCGRPLGLQFYKATGDLYIADAYLGLLGVGPEGGVATQIASGADGEPFHFLNGLDVDQETGMVYFTDSSTKFQRRTYQLVVLTRDATGRLLRYDPESKKVTVLLKDIIYPNGVVLNNDGSFLLISQTTTSRILRYWLRGPKAGMYDVFAELPGYPDNITKNPAGEFWVALSQENQLSPTEVSQKIAVRLSREGRILEVLNGPFFTSISEVKEYHGALWVGSVTMPYVGVYRL